MKYRRGVKFDGEAVSGVDNVPSRGGKALKDPLTEQPLLIHIMPAFLGKLQKDVIADLFIDRFTYIPELRRNRETVECSTSAFQDNLAAAQFPCSILQSEVRAEFLEIFDLCGNAPSLPIVNPWSIIGATSDLKRHVKDIHEMLMVE
jgi:hypothetical protein